MNQQPNVLTAKKREMYTEYCRTTNTQGQRHAAHWRITGSRCSRNHVILQRQDLAVLHWGGLAGAAFHRTESAIWTSNMTNDSHQDTTSLTQTHTHTHLNHPAVEVQRTLHCQVNHTDPRMYTERATRSLLTWQWTLSPRASEFHKKRFCSWLTRRYV